MYLCKLNQIQKGLMVSLLLFRGDPDQAGGEECGRSSGAAPHSSALYADDCDTQELGARWRAGHAQNARVVFLSADDSRERAHSVPREGVVCSSRSVRYVTKPGLSEIQVSSSNI